jgi:hypothetical protein
MMIPDPVTVARRRHVATCLARAGLVLWGLWVSLRAAGAVWDFVQLAMIGNPVQVLVHPLLGALGDLGIWAVALLLHGRIVRWVVPMGKPADVCPRCGYSLRNLRGGVCPECGLDLAAGGQAAGSAGPAAGAVAGVVMAAPVVARGVPRGRVGGGGEGEMTIPPPPGHR